MIPRFLKKTYPKFRKFTLEGGRIDVVSNFSNVSDELVFWKARSSKLQQALRETQNSLTEYQVESKEYETELENSLEVYDSQNLELKRTVDILQLENEHWKVLNPSLPPLLSDKLQEKIRRCSTGS